ncbi:hypothetical protein CDG60_12995 [Acinetobacter chinensis]|uniref:Uncharacterized protein n=1 Tax=Acinetobacter chinensis TaxID=2004650 RepID=A0A3B7LYC1_9GAMM|nr:hypothetical protein [Acinetobacter chinensis]AXY57398.1 hypothetical protein CDG60_12995 [Acinetobacter chinensis]
MFVNQTGMSSASNITVQLSHSDQAASESTSGMKNRAVSDHDEAQQLSLYADLKVVREWLALCISVQISMKSDYNSQQIWSFTVFLQL